MKNPRDVFGSAEEMRRYASTVLNAEVGIGGLIDLEKRLDVPPEVVEHLSITLKILHDYFDLNMRK